MERVWCKMLSFQIVTQVKKAILIVLILGIIAISIYIAPTLDKRELSGVPLGNSYKICAHERSLGFIFGDIECAWHVKLDKQLILSEKFIPADEADLAFAKNAIVSLLDISGSTLAGFNAYRIPHTERSTYYLFSKSDSIDIYIYLFTN